MKLTERVCIISTVINMNRIKELRTTRGMKQLELASLLRVNQQTVSKYESEALGIDPNTIRQLCAIFNCTSDYLLCLSDRREPELTPEEIELLAAYHTATQEIRNNVDFMLEPYRQKKETAAG